MSTKFDMFHNIYHLHRFNVNVYAFCYKFGYGLKKNDA